MTELELIIDLHKHSERQGPGSEHDTLKALALVHLPQGQALKVADLGCGSGGQTLLLASHIEGRVTAVDLFPAFLQELHEKSKQRGLADKIVPLEGSMDDLPFNKEEFDLIWSEGAIYNIGFENGLQKWKDFLKVGGYLAVSEITWITPTRPKAVEEFWTSEYPEISTAAVKIAQLEKHGYTLAGYFYLGQDSWMESYYTPLQARFDAFLERNHHPDLAQKIVEEYETEINFYRQFKAYYSYGFYVAQKNK